MQGIVIAVIMMIMVKMMMIIIFVIVIVIAIVVVVVIDVIVMIIIIVITTCILYFCAKYVCRYSNFRIFFFNVVKRKLIFFFHDCSTLLNIFAFPIICTIL